jgi:hypothetical protein
VAKQIRLENMLSFTCAVSKDYVYKGQESAKVLSAVGNTDAAMNDMQRGGGLQLGLSTASRNQCRPSVGINGKTAYTKYGACPDPYSNGYTDPKQLFPTKFPTISPTFSPTKFPTVMESPTLPPTREPTPKPTASPTNYPTPSPTKATSEALLGHEQVSNRQTYIVVVDP